MSATSVPVLGVSPGSGCVSLFVTGVFSTGFSGVCTGLVGVGAGSAFALGFTASALDGLAGAHFENAAFEFDAQQTGEDDGVFVEVGSLAGLDPAAGTAHVGDAEVLGGGVHAADEFVDELGLIARRGDACGLGD